MDIDLPLELRSAIENLVGPSKRVIEAVREMSGRYRAGEGTCLESETDTYAYAAYRMPATYAAIYAALEQVRSLLPRWSPRSLLDVGAGPGTAMWAALTLWPDITKVDLVEPNQRMVKLGKQLAARSPYEAIRRARWLRADAESIPQGPKYDLVVMAYVMGEMDERRPKVVERLWGRTGGLLVLVEPGTPAGFRLIRADRERLLALGAKVVAPCPHGETCPVEENDWCHFSQRIARSSLQRKVKSGELPYEDEKFSCIVASREEVPKPVSGRIIRHPHIKPGHIIFQVCTPRGIERVVISRKDKDLFRQARDARWGSLLPEKAGLRHDRQEGRGDEGLDPEE